MKLENILLEFKDRPVPEGKPDPALMTFDEYAKVANPKNKTHSDTSYQQSGELEYHNYNDYKPLRRFQSRGVEFEMKIKKEKGRYVKVDPKRGETVRDEKGNPQYYSDEELKTMGINPYTYTAAVFHEKKCVGAAQDEWGALLIMVVQEYQGFGLGPMLGKVARSYDPYADSGGFTGGGYNNLRKVHQSFVRDYMTNGTYSQLVRKGVITSARAKEIMKSANIDQKSKEKSNVGETNEKFLWSNDTNAWIVYDANLRNVIQDESVDELFSEKLIHAFCFIVNEEPTYLFQLDYNQEKYGKLVLEAALAEVERHGDELRIRNENWKEVHERVKKLGYDVEIDEPFPEGEIPYSHIKKFTNAEKRWRKSFDQYDEFQILMQELAEKLYNS